MNIAFFDFDGTITTKDSLEDFICFAVGKPKYYLGLLAQSPMLVAYKLKLLANHKAKAKLMAHYFKGWSEQEFTQIAEDYCEKALHKIIKKDALERLQWHQQQGDKVVLVSASMRHWLGPWAHKQGIDLLCTELEVENGQLTGAFATNNCYGPEKARRIHSAYQLDGYEKIYAYGDSSGDKEMLALAHEQFYCHFNGPTLA